MDTPKKIKQKTPILFYYSVVCSTKTTTTVSSPLSQSLNRHRKVVSTHRHKSVSSFSFFGFGKLYFIFYSIGLQSHNTRDQNIPVCIYITYLLSSSYISSLLRPHYCAGIHEMAPLQLSMASMNEGRTTSFVFDTVRSFFALKFYVQFTGAFSITGI